MSIILSSRQQQYKYFNLVEIEWKKIKDTDEEMGNACRDRDMTAMTTYRMHTELVIRRARECVHAGVIGEPIHSDDDIS